MAVTQLQTQTQRPQTGAEGLSGPNKVKIILIGRGQPTKRQLQLLAKALHTEPNSIEIAKVIEQLNSPKQITEALQETGSKAVLSLVLHPAVIANLSTAKRFINFNYFVVQTEAIKTANVSSKEEATKLCQNLNADIANIKVLPNGEVSVRCLRTAKLLKNPVIRIEAEEEIQ